MAIVIRTRIQDDLSPNALTSFALARPAGRSQGPADRRSDLPDRSSAAASNTRKESAISFLRLLCPNVWCVSRGLKLFRRLHISRRPYGTCAHLWRCHPTLKFGANNRCAYGAGQFAGTGSCRLICIPNLQYLPIHLARPKLSKNDSSLTPVSITGRNRSLIRTLCGDPDPRAWRAIGAFFLALPISVVMAVIADKGGLPSPLVFLFSPGYQIGLLATERVANFGRALNESIFVMAFNRRWFTGQ